MKIKRYFSKSLREALKQVKEELGSDAVILSNNKVEGGIELVAAIDYDETIFTDKTQNSSKTSKSHFKKAEITERHDSDAFVTGLQKREINTSSPDWLTELKQKNTSIDPVSLRGSENVIKDDIVTFTNRNAKQEKKKDPSIRTSAVNDLLKKDNFSQLIDKELSRSQVVQDSSQKDKKTNPFDFDALISSSEQVYQKPKIKSRDKIKNIAVAREKKQVGMKKSETIEWSQDPILLSMKDDIQMLRGMLQNQMSGLAWGDFNRNNPHRSELMQRLYKLGMKPSISETILKQVDESNHIESSWKKTLSLISKGIKLSQQEIINEGGMIALVGPTGVGKTTTLAKMAARFALQYGVADMAIVSMDSYRVGAQEQLKIYGQLLRVPVYIVSNKEELSHTLKRLAEKNLVLIDTAGMNQKDIRMTEQLSMLRNSHPEIKILSVISASAQSYAVHEVIEVFKAYAIDGCIVTKLDESTSLGGVLSVLIENQLVLHYVTDGQKVPEDIHPGRASNLLKIAMGIVRERKDAYDYNDIAMSFVGELIQANG